MQTVIFRSQERSGLVPVRATMGFHCRPPSSRFGLPKRSIPQVRLTISANTVRSTDLSIRNFSNERCGRSVSEAETLQVQITESAGEPRQIVGAAGPWSMPFFDVSAEPDARASAEAWMRADLDQVVDPLRGPLFRFALFKVISRPDFFGMRGTITLSWMATACGGGPPFGNHLHSSCASRTVAGAFFWPA